MPSPIGQIKEDDRLPLIIILNRDRSATIPRSRSLPQKLITEAIATQAKLAQQQAEAIALQASLAQQQAEVLLKKYRDRFGDIPD